MTDTRSSDRPAIWGTYLRWMALCRNAWTIVLEGLVPVETSTPPIVGETRVEHDKLVSTVKETVEAHPKALMVDPNPETTYYIRVDHMDEWRRVTLKPDLYLLLETPIGPVNVPVEVTTRTPIFIPQEWLTAYSLGYYLRNLRPTLTLLVTPDEIKALPLSTENLLKLKRLIEDGPRRRVPTWVCSNCDLRPVCPEPYGAV